MLNREMTRNAPAPYPQTVRNERRRVWTSIDAGKIYPLATCFVHREDRVRRGAFEITVSMKETVKTVQNGIQATAQVWFVPFFADPKFNGDMGCFNRSFMGQPQIDGSTIPFFGTKTFNKDEEIYLHSGHHANGEISDAFERLYNVLVNFRRGVKSTKIRLRELNNSTAAAAFWPTTPMSYIVPDFEAASIDGTVPLNLVGKAPVEGIGPSTESGSPQPGSSGTLMTGGKTEQGDQWFLTDTGGNMTVHIHEDAANPGFPAIYTNLDGVPVSLSLANIELARKTEQFAALRRQYRGKTDEYIIDMLMRGLTVPDEYLKEPILLASQNTLLGQSPRYSTDFQHLDEYVSEGMTRLGLSFAMPKTSVGGFIYVTLEVCPEQVFERQSDMVLAVTSPDQLPDAEADFLDPEPVAAVPNSRVDVLHSAPTGVFGYEPLNMKWDNDYPKVGGKFYRPVDDAFVEDRQAIWSVEEQDPTLSDSFYLVPPLPKTIFADQTADPFEVLCVGSCELVGLTQRGPRLFEDDQAYSDTLDHVDTDRIDQDQTTTPEV